jgi:hypothetical protein
MDRQQFVVELERINTKAAQDRLDINTKAAQDRLDFKLAIENSNNKFTVALVVLSITVLFSADPSSLIGKFIVTLLSRFTRAG